MVCRYCDFISARYRLPMVAANDEGEPRKQYEPSTGEERRRKDRCNRSICTGASWPSTMQIFLQEKESW